MFQDGAHGPRGPHRASRPRASSDAARWRATLAALVWVALAATGAQAQGLLQAPARGIGRDEAPALTRADDVCEAAGRMAAEAHGVPLDVMRAITRVETGTGRGAERRGWPWSANADGRSLRFDSLEEALAYAASPAAHAASNVDLGCFQISRRWHGENFSGDREMLDPARNALYAARLLAEHYARLGDWTRAAGAYHSRTEVHASRYRNLFAAELAALGPAPDLGPLLASDPSPGPGPTFIGDGSLLAARLPTPSAPIPVRAPARGAGGGVFTRVAGLASEPAREPGVESDPRIQRASYEPDADIVRAPPLASDPQIAPDPQIASDPQMGSEPRMGAEPEIGAEPSRASEPRGATPLYASARPLLGAAGPGGARGSLVSASSGAGPLTGGGNGPLIGPRGWGG